MAKRDVSKLEIILYLIVLVAVIGALLNIPSWLTNSVIQLLVSAFTGLVCSIVTGTLIEAFTGDLLKKIAFNIEIHGFGFSITVFAIATLIVKTLLFGW